LTVSRKGAKIFGGSPNFLMPQRDKTPPSGPKPPKFPFLMRTQAMGSDGWEGYTVGFTLVGCIAAGAGAGYLLDSHFKTNYWLPILFLVGVAGGFREMWVVIKRLDKQELRKKVEKEAATPVSPLMPRVPSASAPAPEQVPERKRQFEVPPPPFEEMGVPHKESQTPRTAPPAEDVDDLLKRLLAEAEDEEEPPQGGPSATR